MVLVVQLSNFVPLSSIDNEHTNRPQALTTSILTSTEVHNEADEKHIEKLAKPKKYTSEHPYMNCDDCNNCTFKPDIQKTQKKLQVRTTQYRTC